MKRIISVLLVLVLCFSCLVVPGSAELDDSFVDLLALSNQDEFLFRPEDSSYVCRFDIPYSFYRYIDCLIYSNVRITSAYAYSSSSPLTVMHVGGNYWRVYGSLPNGGSYIDLGFNFESDCSVLNFVSARVSLVRLNHYSLGGSWQGYTSGSTFWSGTFDGVNRADIFQELTGNNAYSNFTYDFSMNFFPGITDAWKAYDKISFSFYAACYDINSIVGICDGVNVIESVSFLDNGSYSDLRYNINGQYFLESSNDARYITVTLDLTNIQKTIDSYPCITINGSYEPSPNYNVPLLTIGRVDGIIVDDFDVEATWYKRIWSSISDGFSLLRSNLFSLFASLQNNLSTWLVDLGSYLGNLLTTLNNNLVAGLTNIATKLNTLISGSDEQLQNSSDFNDSIDDQSSELEDMTDVMDSVEKPPVADVNMDVSSFVDASVITLTTTGIGTILSNEIIIRVLLLAFTFGLIGFILYGKK